MTDTPDDLRYSTDHLWVRTAGDDGLVRIGLTQFAQESLGDVVEVTLPDPGDTVRAGSACGDIESVKSVNDVVAPVTGTIRTGNAELADDPGLVNSDPYGRGWLFEAAVDPAVLAEQLGQLLDATAYRALVGA